MQSQRVVTLGRLLVALLILGAIATLLWVGHVVYAMMQQKPS